MEATVAKAKMKTENPEPKIAKAAKSAKTRKPKVAIGLLDEAPTMGRPVKYQPKFADIARVMARLGGTDYEIAEELGVATSTVWRWRSKYPDFCNALNEGKDAF